MSLDGTVNEVDHKLELYSSEVVGCTQPTSSNLSLVATAYTQERFQDLTDLIDSIRAQSAAPELIIVIERDQRLKTNLLNHLRKVNMKWLIIFSSNRLGISNARNLGIKHSTGSMVAFVDDDAVLANDWAAKVNEVFLRHPEVLGITGPVLPLWVDKSAPWFPKSLYWVIGCTAWRSDTKENLADSVSGTNMIFRRKAFETTLFTDEFTDGFQKEGKMGLPNDDNDFVMRLVLATGCKLLYSPELKVYHKVHPFKTSLKYVRRYSFWQGVAEARYSSKYALKTRDKPHRHLLNSTLHDLVSLDRWWPNRVFAIALSFLFGFAGYVSYRNRALLAAFRMWI